MRIKFKHLGIVARPRTLRNLVLKSWNLAWCHVMVVPCRGKKNGRIGTNFGISFLQTGASLKKARGSERERVTFVCIIQIWNTSTCSSAPKLVQKSHVCPRVNFYVPCKKWEWNSNIWASWLGRKDWETWFLNSCKSKTCLKIMKLGMVSWHWHQHVVVFFLSNLRRCTH